MKRYWKSIVLAAGTIVVIGAFYVYLGLAGNHYPELAFAKGDEKVVEDVVLYGSIYGDTEWRAEFRLNSDGMVYDDDLSFLERFYGRYTNKDILRLQKEHRNFMRGKNPYNIGSYYENDMLVAYVTSTGDYNFNTETLLHKLTFDIEMLNKTTNETTSFTIDVPNKENYYYVAVEGIQIVNDQITVLTCNSLSVNDYSEEMHIYHLDLANQQVTNDTIIQFKTEQLKEMWSYIEIVNDMNHIGAEDYLLFRLNYEWNDESLTDSRKSEYVVYNVKTNTQASLDFPEDIQLENAMVFVEGDSLYTVTLSENTFQITVFDPDTQRVENVQTVKAPSSYSGNPDIEEYPFNIKNGLLYLANTYTTPPNDLPTLTVINIGTGNIVYEKSIEEKKSDTVVNYSGVDIYQITTD